MFEGDAGDPKTLAAKVTKLRPLHHRLADRVRAHMPVTFFCLVSTYDAAGDRDIGEGLFFVSDADAQIVGRFLRKA